MVAIRISAFLLAVLPLILVANSLARESRAGKRGLFAAIASFLVVFASLGFAHHRNYFAPLDAMCYRSLANQFANGATLNPNRNEIATLPGKTRSSVFWRRNCHAIDAVFKYKDSKAAQSADGNDEEAFKTTPAFLPYFPLAASALGRAHEFFTPLVGALWFTVVLLASFAYSKKWKLAVAIAALCALITCFPSWFFRDYHAEAPGAALISAAFALLLVKRGLLDFALAGFCLSLAAAFHLTMFLFALPIAIYAVTSVGKWKQDFALLAGLALGIVPALAELALTGNPYLKTNGISDWTTAAKNIPVIGAMIGVTVLILVGGVAALFAASSKKCRAFFDKPSVSGRVKALLIFAIAGLCCLPFAGGVLKKGVFSVHPAMLAIWTGFIVYCIVPLCRKQEKEKSALLAFFLLVCCGLFGFYVKGTEIEVGMWSFRRMMPFAVVCAPICAYGLAKICETSKMALAVPAVLTVFAMILSPFAWFGVNGRGTERVAEDMQKEFSKEKVVFSDYIQRSVAVTALTDVRILGLNQGADAKSRDSFLDAHFSPRSIKTDFLTSYEPCTLELETELVPKKTFECEYATVMPKRMIRAVEKTSRIKDTLLAETPAGKDCRQKKIFDGGPLGLRGEWKRANRGGYWCGEGAAVIGPVPADGRECKVTLSAGWFDASGTNPVSRLRITPPGETSPMEFDISGPNEKFSAIVKNENPSSETTGLWRFYGDAVIYEIEIAP